MWPMRANRRSPSPKIGISSGAGSTDVDTQGSYLSIYSYPADILSSRKGIFSESYRIKLNLDWNDDPNLVCVLLQYLFLSCRFFFFNFFSYTADVSFLFYLPEVSTLMLLIFLPYFIFLKYLLICCLSKISIGNHFSIQM